MLLPAFFVATDGFGAEVFGSVDAAAADVSFSFCFPNICSMLDFGFDVSGSALALTSGLFSSLTATSGSENVFEARGAARLLKIPLRAVVGLKSFLQVEDIKVKIK